MTTFHHSGKPGEAPSARLVGLEVIFRLIGQATEGRFSLVEHPIAPGTLAPPRSYSKGKIKSLLKMFGKTHHVVLLNAASLRLNKHFLH